MDPPDLLLDPGLAQQGFRVRLDELESYLKWDPADDLNLAKLLTEIRDKYKVRMTPTAALPRSSALV